MFVPDRNHSSYSERLKQDKSSSRSHSSLMRNYVRYLIRASSLQALKKFIHLGDIKKEFYVVMPSDPTWGHICYQDLSQLCRFLLIVSLSQPRAVADTELK